MTYDEIKAAWNAQADEYNQWGALSEAEKIEWSASIAAAKERTARKAAQEEVVALKERITHAGVEQRRAVCEAVLEEREACAQVAARMPKDWLAAVPTVNQQVTVPTFTAAAQYKLMSLLSQGFSVTGYSIERADVADWAPQRGFITHGGMVGWWLPHAADARKEAES